MGEGGQSRSAVSDPNTAKIGHPGRENAWETWTPFQRTLVSTDGTVTRTLEAFTGEDIKCVKLDQAFGKLKADEGEDEALEAPAGSTVIRRTILLRGRRSLCNYIHAQSTVLVDRVPVTMVYGMIYTSKPVGVLLAEDRVETTREILRVGEEPAEGNGQFFGVGPETTMIVRTYRIVVGRDPALLITERFPASSFGETGASVGGRPGEHGQDQ